MFHKPLRRVPEAYRHAGDQRKSAMMGEPSQGAVVIASYSLARQILRSGVVRQAGFKADLLERFAGKAHMPVLFQEGEAHQKQRTATARFFAPRTVTTRYRALIERQAQALLDPLRASGSAELDQMSLSMAVSVMAEIVGLTDSSQAGMSRRLGSFFAREPAGLRAFVTFVVNQLRMLAFYTKDVKPAIAARRGAPREDVISHLLGQGCSDREILTECVTYGAAGMATTREFIVMAAWHLFERADLKARFLAADEGARIAILEEILRLEPVVGALHRRTSAELILDHDGERVCIPAGRLVTLDVRGTNSDPAVTGDCPYRLEPGQARTGNPASLMSFGDGPHRCPGAPVALLETAIFLGHLFAIRDVRLSTRPTLAWNNALESYELRGAVVAIT
jgi:cytochrome P450